ncbi:unnamed protein product [Clonostachys byssicola]|uniref:Xylanolytic transcriptional activator regulatory domain-containing protein n=1 Tax=Clonostachys byssicola TaxID=160290 RepID=A0A9N9UJG5_9HYPO|nr:unnamed protein product [Clonostachys byssicola]
MCRIWESTSDAFELSPTSLASQQERLCLPAIYPQCSNCEAAGTECLSYDLGKQREIPRDYVESLEAQIERLKAEVQLLGSRPCAAPNNEASSSEQASSTTPQSDHETGSELYTSLALAVLDPSDEPRFVGTSSGVTLAKAILGSLECNMPVSPSVRSSQEPNMNVLLPRSSPPLPSKESATYLIDIYFQCRTPHLPLMERADILRCVQNAYQAHDNEAATVAQRKSRDVFITLMIFAISCCGLKGQVGRGASDRSESFFHSAVQCLDSTIGTAANDTKTLTDILLLAQYVSLSPSKGNLWTLSGLAIRACIELGFHWETNLVLRITQAQLNERRRLFWAAYYFDRLLVVTIGRPLGIEEQSLGAGYPDLPPVHPSPEERHAQRVANHIVRLARLEAETKHVLYRQQHTVSVAFPQPDYHVWMEDIKPRLEQWHVDIPPTQEAHPESIYACSSWWEATYNHALLLLHRPTPRVPKPSPASLSICFEASTKLIEHDLGLGSSPLRGRLVAHLLGLELERAEKIACPERIVNIGQICASSLAAVAERYPKAAGCRDAIESMVAATVRRLFASQDRVPAWPISADSGTHQQDAFWPPPQPGHTDDFMEGIYSLLPEDLWVVGQGACQGLGWPILSGEDDRTVLWRELDESSLQFGESMTNDG